MSLTTDLWGWLFPDEPEPSEEEMAWLKRVSHLSRRSGIPVDRLPTDEVEFCLLEEFYNKEETE